MEKEKIIQFLRELNQLEDRHGIYISTGYSETIDYSSNGEPYVSDIDTCFVFYDKEGNEISLDSLDIDDFIEIWK